jgi:hypothetical protein
MISSSEMPSETRAFRKREAASLSAHRILVRVLEPGFGGVEDLSVSPGPSCHPERSEEVLSRAAPARRQKIAQPRQWWVRIERMGPRVALRRDDRAFHVAAAVQDDAACLSPARALSICVRLAAMLLRILRVPAFPENLCRRAERDSDLRTGRHPPLTWLGYFLPSRPRRDSETCAEGGCFPEPPKLPKPLKPCITKRPKPRSLKPWNFETLPL